MDTSTQSTHLKLKVIPNSAKSVIIGWLGDVLKVKVSASPEKGKANFAVEVLISEALGLSKGDVKITSGRTSPKKIIEIQGLSQEEICQRLQLS